MEPLVLTTREQLKELISEVFAEMLPKLSPQPAQKELLPLEEAVAYMKSRGYLTTKASLYGYVSSKRIPFRKVNGKLIFERTSIDGWVSKELSK
jgi:hypothetical protein